MAQISRRMRVFRNSTEEFLGKTAYSLIKIEKYSEKTAFQLRTEKVKWS